MGARTILVAGLSLALVSLAAPSTSVKADLDLRATIGAGIDMPVSRDVASPSSPVRAVVATGTSASLHVVAPATRQAPATVVASAKGVARGSTRVPAGCDRLVSSLVKSTASLMVGRCVT